MQYLAKWGPKGFLVSPNKIVPFEGFSTSFKTKDDSNNDTSGKAKTNTRGKELISMSFETTYLRAAGTDPRSQIEEWKSLLDKSYPLIIGGERFGPNKMQLKQVDVSDCLFSNTGKMLKVKIKITLKEDAGSATSTKAKSSSSSSASSKAKATYEKTVAEKRAAMNATASKEDKAEKKKGGGA